MSKSTTADLCRLSIATPDHVVELAVPGDCPVADFLPAILSFGGRDLGDRGLVHDGWVLQRLGGLPLAESRTLDELGVLDGETLYLRPRRELVPEAVFDDLVDGLAAALRERQDRWREAARRWSGPLSGALLLAAALAALTSAAPRTRCVAAGIAALVLVAGSALAARISRSSGGAVVLGVAAGGYAAAGGVFGAWLADRSGSVGSAGSVAAAATTTAAAHAAHLAHEASRHGATTVLWGGAAALVALVLAQLLSAAPAEVFVACGGVAAAAVIAGGVALVRGGDLVAGAAAVGVLALGSVLAVPTLAFRGAGLRLPALPVTAADIQRDEQPGSETEIHRSARTVERLMAAFLAAVGAVAVAGAAVVAGAHGSGPYLAADLSVALLLRARVFSRTPLRVLLQAAGMLALGATAWRVAAGQPLAVALATAAVGLVLAAVAARPDEDRPPYAARAADVLEYLAVGALVPLALAVAGVFGWARGIGA